MVTNDSIQEVNDFVFGNKVWAKPKKARKGRKQNNKKFKKCTSCKPNRHTMVCCGTAMSGTEHGASNGALVNRLQNITTTNQDDVDEVV